MLNLLNKALAKIFGTKAERDLKRLLPWVEKINKEWEALAQSHVTDDMLRAKTYEIKQYIEQRLQGIDNQIAQLHQKIEQEPDVLKKETLFEAIDAKEKERNKQLEVVLLEVLPLAFAIVKETARRLKENKQLVVTATDWDRELVEKYKKTYITLEEGKAIWANTWIAAGNPVTWDMVHYDVQLIGGVVLHEGKIAEMATGEGKTLVATLPAFLNALAKRGVHIVTVNDYLAKRDCQWMGPIYEFHGLRVDCIDLHEPHTEARKHAYQADITYGTNNEFGFDYLRDNMARDLSEVVQRKLHFAIVDEVDSVLIDDARTPLIIAGPVGKTNDEQLYYELKPRIERLVEAQKKIVNEFLQEAKKKLALGDEKEGGLALFRAFRGLPKSKPLIRFLSETGKKQILQKTEAYYLQDNQKYMPEADKPLYFTIDEKNNQVELTERGIEFITMAGEDANFFVLPDIATQLSEIEKKFANNEAEKFAQKEKLLEEYSLKSERIHAVQQLLKAYCLFEKDVDYIIDEGKVKIVDEQTGRIMEGRRWSDGLHQAIEAKEKVKVEEATQTYATITLQNYFRMYHKLAGMTGTAETEAAEFWEIYKLDVVVIPTHKKVIREDRNDVIFKTSKEKYAAIIAEIERLVNEGRPVLVGTTSVENSELLSRMLNFKKIKHQVLNARLHQKEAEIIAEAGKPRTVTIATNMAGRGTDIKLTPESRAAGGLAIIGTERHESRRVDRQLRGRAGRQGDPGSSQFFISFEDNLMRIFGSDSIAKWMDRLGMKEGESIQAGILTRSVERAQKKVEENNFGIRKRLLEYDNVMNAQREIIYRRRRNALQGERLELDIVNTFYDVCELLVTSYQAPGNYENFKMELHKVFNITPSITEQEFYKSDAKVITQKCFQEAIKGYQERCKKNIDNLLPAMKNLRKQRPDLTEVLLPLPWDNKPDNIVEIIINLDDLLNTEGKHLTKTIQKFVSLKVIDIAWKDHLREMDDLRQSVQNAVLEQKDPLLVYKFDAFELFSQLIANINREIVETLTHLSVPEINIELEEKIGNKTKNIKPTKRPVSRDNKTKEFKPNYQTFTNQAAIDENLLSDKETQEPVKTQPIRVEKKIDRNAKVNVRYTDGRIVKDVKFKNVEEDIRKNKCEIID
ncbi:MAG: preprotein translocase subunit SecA [Microscillaceae bacterium]|nr:preprotein translocase subunit SecA [Microscillaceae bacterium]MDW8460297.1 preprotein translocase subunit SecA [Cytophagales bacterium]